MSYDVIAYRKQTPQTDTAKLKIYIVDLTVVRGTQKSGNFNMAEKDGDKKPEVVISRCTQQLHSTTPKTMVRHYVCSVYDRCKQCYM